MAEPPQDRKPVLNPVLILRKEPSRKEAERGGKKEEDIVVPRLPRQRKALSGDITEILEHRSRQAIFSDHIMLVAEMFDDSFAPSKAPRDLLHGSDGVWLRGAAVNGYLAECRFNELDDLRSRIAEGRSISVRCDISRVKKLRAFDASDVFRSRTIDRLWQDSFPGDLGRAFHIWLMPFENADARESLITRLDGLSEAGTLVPTWPKLLLGGYDASDESSAPQKFDRNNSVAIAKREYRGLGHARALIETESKESLRKVISSGSVYRIEPAQNLCSAAAGDGPEPGPLPSDIALAPIVGLIDGGCNARRYMSAEAWREPPLVATGLADTRHGNQVTSVVVHGHEWNNNLPLPELYSRVGIAQAIARIDAGVPSNPGRLIAYIDSAMSHHPETRVWNLSWNEINAADPIFVSALGHDLSVLARKHSALFVISAGNVSSTFGSCIAPPADCEAALVVGGRQFDKEGTPGDVCPESLPGHGPELRLVPHLCSFSPLRILGGAQVRATSFPTCLISTLAAHTFEHLVDPEPDLVKALLVNQTDLPKFRPDLGWGTPTARYFPWNCAPGTVTLIIKAKVRTGMRYYWEEIPIPKELILRDKIRGRASLTVVHRPLCRSEGGPNYISTRVAAAIQYPNHSGKYTRLLGSKETDDTLETEARVHEFKWQPFWREYRDFTKPGLSFNGSSFKLYARFFARDIEQFGYSVHSDIPETPVYFVITFSDGSDSSNLYNNLASSLGSFVQSAVVDQDIDVEH